MADPQILLYIGLESQAGTFFRLNDPVRGVLGNTTYPLAGDIAVDITDESQSISTRRGRNSEFEDIAAGSVTIGWPNDSRQFDPLYAGSPYYGSDLVGKRLQVLVAGKVIADTMTEDWNFDYAPDAVSWVTVTAFDSMGQLAGREFNDWVSTAGLPGDRINEVLNRDEVGFGVNRDVDTGVSPLQADVVSWGSNVLNYLQLVAKSDFGRLFVAADGALTFRDRFANHNQSPEAVFTDTEAAGILFQSIKRTRGTELLFNRVSVDRVGGIKQTAEDLTSQAKYGIRSLSLSSLLLDSDIAAANMANYLLALYAYPITRIKSLTVILDGMDPAKAGAVLALEIGDVAQVLFTPDGVGAEIDQLVVVEGIAHTLATAGVHTVTLSFSTFDGRTFFRLNDPVRGLLTSGNVLAF